MFSAFASGDTSEWFSLPGGPVRFAVGAEYRRESLFFQADPFIEDGFSFYNALPTFEPDPFDVKEAFAEIQIPLLADTPFFEQLSVERRGSRRQLSAAAPARSGPTMPASNGRRSATSGSAAITAVRCVRRT